MMRYRRARHACQLCDISDAFLAVAEQPEDLCPAAVPEKAEKLSAFLEVLVSRYRQCFPFFIHFFNDTTFPVDRWRERKYYECANN